MAKLTIIGSEKSGRTTLASKLGKKGRVSDFTMYDFVKNNNVLTIIDATGYPKSVKPMMAGFNLSEIVLLCIPPEGLDTYLAECIISLALLEYKHGIIVLTKSDTTYQHAVAELQEKIKKVIVGTSLENWNFLSVSTVSFDGMEELKTMIFDIEDTIKKESEKLNDLPARIIVDQSFNVTGIGCVVLGVVTQGTIRVQDKMRVYPGEKLTEIRSIQLHDTDAKSATANLRVGLALRNIQSKDIERGFILSNGETVTEKLKLNCHFTPLSGGVAIGDVPHVFTGLQSAPMRVENITVNGNDVETTENISKGIITLSGTKPLAYNESDKFIICNLDDKQRFVGCGYPA